MEKIDLRITGAKVFNTYFKKFMDGDIWIKEGRFFYIDKSRKEPVSAAKEVDCAGKYIIPGLVDIHMHIESSMMTPGPFCQRLAQCGVTTIVAEPHEIVNVKGPSAITHMAEAGKSVPIDIYYAIPSSVPATSPELETTGGVVTFEDMARLKESREVICVGEVMNYRQIIKENDLDIYKFIQHLGETDPQYIIEGHCPSLVDLDLAKFLFLGINADHTEHSLEEIIQRYENGMFVEIQDKMLKQEILDYIGENKLYEHTAFVTDDTMPDELYLHGHLDAVVRRAMEMGFNEEEAIYCATYTPAVRMNLRDRGAIAPGKLADFLILDDVKSLAVTEVYKNGKSIYGRGDNTPPAAYRFPENYYHSVYLKDISADVFEVFVPEDVTTVTANVMAIQPGSTQTRWEKKALPVAGHKIQWQDSDICLVMVFERHNVNHNIGYGFASGGAIKKGAVATTYVHDHHNLLVMGTNAQDMLVAANRIIAMQGGFAVVEKGQVLADMPLPVGGILSEAPVAVLGQGIGKVREAMFSLGYDHANPLMSLSTLGLAVSPALKITDKGLIDVKESKIVPLYQL